VIDIMTRLKIHHMAEGDVPQAIIAEQCGVGLRSVERILAEPVPSRADVLAGERAGAPRRGRPPKADTELVEKIRQLLAEPKRRGLPATEVLRLARGWGYTGGRSQMSALVKSLRPEPSREPIVLFDGLPGEYTQFDFGECKVRLSDGGSLRVQFFAARLKCSRFMHVMIVPDQQAETLARAVIASIEALGGSTKEWVFDNPRTVRISNTGVTPVVLHPNLRQLVAEYNVIATLCAPRAGNQKGSVERLVGYVKNSFLRVRHFRDLGDLEQQLGEWLHEVNFVRPCDATGIVPAVAREEEHPWLAQRPLQVRADAWAIERSATVTPMGTVSYEGTQYAATERHLGATATLLIRKNEVEVIVSGQRSVHAREDHTGEVRRLPSQRAAVLKVLHGDRKRATFRRQCLLELGPEARSFLAPLVHTCPDGRWDQPCEQLYGLLMKHGDDAMRLALGRCVDMRAFSVSAVQAALEVAA
jgi:transposase